MSTDWYETVAGPSLEQGDVLLDCPIYRVDVPSTEGGDPAEVLLEAHDVVVLTQTCDLENEKVEDVLVAAVLSYRTLVEQEGEAKPNIKGTAFRKAAIDGNLPSYFLLAERQPEPSLDWSLVDFHNVFSVPKHLVIRTAETQGGRLRLVSPYKEHLAQAFGRYIMRVGLPTTLDAFKSYSA